MFELRFKITAKNKHGKVVTEVEGGKTAGMEQLTIQEVTETIEETEMFLEKLTGLKFTIEQVG